MSEGAICSALPPEGVVFAYGESTNALLLAMFAAMADALGEGAIAGDADSFSIFYQANSIDTAIEVTEADAPVVILRREYLADTAGAGLHRGGAAVLKDSLFLEPAEHAVITLRLREPTGRGVRGGRDGPTGGVWVWRAGGAPAAFARGTGVASYRDANRVAGRLDPASGAPDARGEYYWFGRERNWPTPAGAVFRYVTNGGGGWGDPFARDPERVRRDVRDGYVSVAAARADYGAIIEGDPETDPEGLRIDAAGTARLRAARKR